MKNKTLIEFIDTVIYNFLMEIKLPEKSHIKKIINNDDVKDYYGNTPFAQKVFKQWGNNSGEYKDAEIFKGRITGNYSSNNIKLGLKQQIGKTNNIIAYLYIPKDIYFDIIK